VEKLHISGRSVIAPKGHVRMAGRWSIPPTRYGGPHDAASSATGIDPMIFGKEKEVKGYHKLLPFTPKAASISGPFLEQSALSECSMKHYSAPFATLMMTPYG
jgi:hypothetical protein